MCGGRPEARLEVGTYGKAVGFSLEGIILPAFMKVELGSGLSVGQGLGFTRSECILVTVRPASGG